MPAHLSPISDIRWYKQISGGQAAAAVLVVPRHSRKYLTYRNIEGGGGGHL